MDDDQRLRRRAVRYGGPLRGAEATIRYLEQVQLETASNTGVTEDPLNIENAGPAYLRGRAMHYRELAKQQHDPKRAQLFLDLAASFERHAVVKERSPVRRP